jgi:ribosomal protein L29
MKTYEELRGMTQEDLVRLVLELQEEIINLKTEQYGNKTS